MAWKTLSIFSLLVSAPISSGRHVVLNSSNTEATAQLTSHLVASLGSESCYAPPGIMSPECVAGESVIGHSYNCWLTYYINEKSDTFSMFCDGYGQMNDNGGWSPMAAGHGSFGGSVPLGKTALTPKIRCQGVGGWGTFEW